MNIVSFKSYDADGNVEVRIDGATVGDLHWAQLGPEVDGLPTNATQSQIDGFLNDLREVIRLGMAVQLLTVGRAVVRCAKCGGTNVAADMWVNINTLAIDTEEGPVDQTFCNTCDDFCEIESGAES